MSRTTKKHSSDEAEHRVIVYMPTGRDALLVCATLEKSGIAAVSCPYAATLRGEIAAGAGAVLLAEEGLQNGALERLVAVFNDQPVWSDLPVVLFVANAHNSEKLLATIGTRMNATIVERPIRVAILISAVRGALRARQKQYQTRDLLHQLEQSDRQKDLFLATLSHELRTPLNSILGWIRLLRGQSRGVDATYGLEVIERNARAQSEIISDILFVSRIITGKLSLNMGPIELVPVIEEAIEVVQPSIEAKKIRIETFFDERIERLDGDRDRLKQVFWNLLSNAVKFTPEGGRIEVRAFADGDAVEIEISDSGIGIEPDFLPYIFERFRQADSSYTRKVGGLGLGLAIVRHLVEAHGGCVDVRSEGANRGTAFTIRLPALAAGADRVVCEERPAAADDGPPAGTRVLLVEDNDDSREMLVALFEQSGVAVAAATSAAEALRALGRERFDVLVSDIGMPELDGYDLIRRVRALAPAANARIPAIALTGFASLQDRELALAAGYQEHLSKPVDVDALFALVRKLLNERDRAGTPFSTGGARG